MAVFYNIIVVVAIIYQQIIYSSGKVVDLVIKQKFTVI